MLKQSINQVKSYVEDRTKALMDRIEVFWRDNFFDPNVLLEDFAFHH